MKEKNVFGVFSKMEDESNKLTGIVSTLFAITDAMEYGASDPKEFAAALNLAAMTLQDFAVKHGELIDQGCEMVKEIKLEKVE